MAPVERESEGYLEAKTGRFDRINARGTAVEIPVALDWFVPTSVLSRVFGHGGGAALVPDRGLRCEFLSYTTQTFGDAYDAMNVAVRSAEKPQIPLSDGDGIRPNFAMRPDFFDDERLGRRMVVESLQRAALSAALTLADIDCVLLHQSGREQFEEWIAVGAEAGIAEEKWIETFDEHGNVGSIDMMLNLAALVASGRLSAGNVIAMFTPGMGGYSPVMLLRWLG